MVCLLAAPLVQLSVSAGNGWSHNALRHHRLMPISCHFRDCKAPLVTSLTHVSGAIASAQTFNNKINFLFSCEIYSRSAFPSIWHMSSKYNTKQYISAKYCAEQMSEIWCKNIQTFLRYSSFHAGIFYSASPCITSGQWTVRFDWDLLRVLGILSFPALSRTAPFSSSVPLLFASFTPSSFPLSPSSFLPLSS